MNAPKLPGMLLFAAAFFLLFETGAPAAPVQVSGGVRFMLLSLERKGGIPEKGLRGSTQEEKGVPGLALNLNSGRWFFGLEMYSGNVKYESGSKQDPQRFLSGVVDITEINLALGFLVFRYVGPFLAYTHHEQTTSGVCSGCDSTFQFSRVEPGLSLNYPIPRTRWGGYARASGLRDLIFFHNDHNWEVGFSYSGIRLPLVAAVGFRQRIISYGSTETPCGGPGSGCFLDRDILSGPVVSLYFVF